MSAPLRQAATWHRPMLVLAGVMGVMAVVSLGGLVVDDRVLLGAPIWLKPFKFAVSIAIYCVTWAWLTALLPRRRLADHVSTVIVLLLTIEYVIIVVQVVRGTTSHFNYSTPLNATLFSIMAFSIAALWTATLVLTVLLLRTPIADPAARWAIRLGALISLAGLALGALMTSPTSDQLDSMERGTFDGIIGAHSVGVADGGPGLPITGWSTTGGDLRIPHFVGMHALQFVPLFALLLSRLATRAAALRHDGVRTRLVLVAAGGYAGVVGLVTWQALRGQPLLSPDGWTLAAAGALTAAVVLGAVGAVRAAPAPDRELAGSTT